MRQVGCVAILLLLGLLASRGLTADEKLSREFASPPDSARIWTWWFWLDDHIDQASITANLEELKAKGIGGVTIYSLAALPSPTSAAWASCPVNPPGPEFVGSAWRELFRHTVHEADRLGLGVSMILCSGWNAGGPWITPEHACKQYVHAELSLTGPQRFQGRLPEPPSDRRFYRDVAVQAFRVTSLKPLVSASSSEGASSPNNAVDGDPGTFWSSGLAKPKTILDKEHPEWLQFDFRQPRTIKRVSIIPKSSFGPRDVELQASDDAVTFRTIAARTMDKDHPADMALPASPIRVLRLHITSTWARPPVHTQIVDVLVDGAPIRREAALWAWKGVRDSFGHFYHTPIREICEAPRKPFSPDEDAANIDPAAIVDLTARCAADGTLDWEVPPGQWLVLRTGCTMIGTMTRQSSASGAGLEADPLDPTAMDCQFAHVGVPLLAEAGSLVPKIFRSVQIDSWEIGLPNWTANFLDEFRKYRGYDPRPYLPALADWTVGSAEIADRFLHDYRNTLGDCVADHCFGRLTALAEAKGIAQQSEAGGVCAPKVMAMDCLKNLGRCAVPMGEFWGNGAFVEDNQNTNGKQTASAAHIYGKPIAAAEAFTSNGHWVESPATLKPLADRAFCEGFNQLFMFSSATHSGDGCPGTEYYAGTYFNRKITWWDHARSWTDYLARCQHLLQQGRFVADVLFYNGDGCPNFVPPKHVDPGLGPGYDYDVCNTEVLLTRLSVQDGKIILPDGMSYRLLVLPDRGTMPVEVAQKLKQLVTAGMTLVGPRPEKAPGLKDYPRCDQEVQAIARELWGPCNGQSVTEHVFGQGRVVWGTKPREILDKAGVKPDFGYRGDQPDSLVDWIHRSADGTEIYYLVNRRDRWEHVTTTFRVGGRQPEIWDPVTGATQDAAAFARDGESTSLRLEFAPQGSLFILFRRPLAAETVAHAPGNFPVVAPAMEVAGPWTVKFDPQWGGPESVIFHELTDWIKRPEDGIKFYSGTATYSTRFDLPENGANSGASVFLDLGNVRNIAAVRLNGKPLGTAWTAPFRLEITHIVRPAGNELEIAVTNLWPNRLIGDAALPEDKRFTRTNIRSFKDNSPLLSSGLLGPVRVLRGGTP